jgi:hypothetical protein
MGRLNWVVMLAGLLAIGAPAFDRPRSRAWTRILSGA